MRPSPTTFGLGAEVYYPVLKQFGRVTARRRSDQGLVCRVKFPNGGSVDVLASVLRLAADPGPRLSAV